MKLLKKGPSFIHCIVAWKWKPKDFLSKEPLLWASECNNATTYCIYPSWLQMYKIFYYALIECAREKRRKMKYERWAQHFFVFCFCMLRLSVFKCLYTLSLPLPHSLTPRCCLVQFLSMQIEIWERSKDRNRDYAVENEWEEACRSWAKSMNYLMNFFSHANARKLNFKSKFKNFLSLFHKI